MNKQQLANRIWASANNMRNKIDANEYKDYILGLVFYKFLSDTEVKYFTEVCGWEEDELIELVENYEDINMKNAIAECQEHIVFFIEYKYLFNTWLNDTSFSVQTLSEAYKYDGRKYYYSYEDRDFSVFNNELSAEEVTILRSNIDMLSRFRDGLKNAWLEEVISNLEYRFGLKSKSDNAVSFEQNEQLTGLKFLSELIDCTMAHQPLNLSYRTYKRIETIVVIHPYHIKQYNNRWFYLVWNNLLIKLESPIGHLTALSGSQRRIFQIQLLNSLNISMI